MGNPTPEKFILYYKKYKYNLNINYLKEIVKFICLF
jgi:hypothetical protein